MIGRILYSSKRIATECKEAFWVRHWKKKVKPISALIRVRNGEEFLEPAIESIIAFVDEVVVVNNCSHDNTPRIIERLAGRHPSIVRSLQYDHDVATVGEESAALFRSDPRSPRLLHNYNNWCIAQCSYPFILKWDDDMIATGELTEEIKKFRCSPYLQFDFGGENVASDYEHFLTWKAAAYYASQYSFSDV